MFLPTAGESGPHSPLLPPSLLTTVLGAWKQARASLGRWGHGALFGKKQSVDGDTGNYLENDDG